MSDARGRATRISIDGLLGRALHDPETGLPNVPFFSLIRDWEERRARRRRQRVRVITISVRGGNDRARRAIGWRLAQSLRASDLIASHGREHYRVLLTSPDAEHADEIGRRLGEVADGLPDAGRLALEVDVEEDRRKRTR